MIYFGDKWSKAVQLRFDGQTMSGISEALQDKAIFAHVPTYGVKVFNRDTGQEIPVDESSLPAPTHEFIVQLKPWLNSASRQRKRPDASASQMRSTTYGTRNTPFTSGII